MIKRRPIRREGRDVLPGLGDEHHQSVRRIAPGEGEQLERVVEHRRVAAVLVEDRQDGFDGIAEEGRGKMRLACAHPGDVALQGVDLAVVTEKTKWLSAVPGRGGIR